MSKGAIVGLGGGILLAVVVGLAIWIGNLRRQVKDGEVLLQAVTQQRDDALEEARLAGKEVTKHKNLAAQAAIDREAAEEALATSRDARARNANSEPKNLPECMDGLRSADRHISLLDEVLKKQSLELRFTKEALAASEHQVDMLEEALRLEGDRITAMEYVRKKKRRKAIGIGIAVGTLVLGAGIAAGVAIGKSG